jgi:hypothetical protein
VATGTVTISGLSTPANTAFVAIPASHNPAMAAQFAADGVDGILGIGMADGASLNTSWYSPLLQLPAPYWEGITLHVSPSGPGTLAIGPVTSLPGATELSMQPPEPAAGYARGVPGYQKDFVACWSVPGGSPGCGDTDIDLGSPNPIFGPGALPGAPTGVGGSTIAAGTSITAAAPGGPALWTYVTGGTPTSGLTALVAQGYTQFNTGIGFFFTHSVAYDVAQGKFLIAGA